MAFLSEKQVKYLEEHIGIAKHLAEQGNAAGQYEYGLDFFYGLGIRRNRKIAMEWIEKAVAQGLPAAQWFLSYCYREGKGYRQDDEQAFIWLKTAAANGYAMAQVELGIHYEDGDNIEQDYDKAVFWYKKAAEHDGANGRDGLFHVACCMLNGRGMEKNEEQAVAIFKQLARQKHTHALWMLGQCYLKGQGIKQNKQKADEIICSAIHYLTVHEMDYYLDD